MQSKQAQPQVILNQITQCITKNIPNFIDKETIAIALLITALSMPGTTAMCAFQISKIVGNIAFMGISMAANVGVKKTVIGAAALMLGGPLIINQGYNASKQGLKSVGVGAIFTMKTIGEVAVEALQKPYFYICSLFSRSTSQILSKLQGKQFTNDQRIELLNKFKHMSFQSEKIFFLVKSLSNRQQEIKLIGLLRKEDRLTSVANYLKLKVFDVEKESLQFFSGRHLVGMNTLMKDLPVNQFGAVQLYFVVSQTFG